MEFDYEHNCLFFADSRLDVIKKLCLTGGKRVTTLTTENLSSVEGMAYDWIGKTLYFVDAGVHEGKETKIEMMKADGSSRRVLIGHNMTFPNEGVITGLRKKSILDQPRSIVLHPRFG